MGHNGSRIPPGSLQHPMGPAERSRGKPTLTSAKGTRGVPGPSLTLAKTPEPGELGQVGHTWGCTLLEGLGEERATLPPARHRAAVAGPGCCLQPCSAPAQHHLPPVWNQPAAAQAPQESDSGSNSARIPSRWKSGDRPILHLPPLPGSPPGAASRAVTFSSAPAGRGR